MKQDATTGFVGCNNILTMHHLVFTNFLSLVCFVELLSHQLYRFVPFPNPCSVTLASPVYAQILQSVVHNLVVLSRNVLSFDY